MPTTSNGHSNPTSYTSPATKLRQLLTEPGKIVYAPGCHDGISARLALSVGCDALYMTGAGVTASRLGLPDLAFASQDDFVAVGTMLAGLDPTVPVICDADTGFGSPNQVARTVVRYHRAGIACLHLEDQVTEKRCGHLGGKQLVSNEEYLVRIRAAVLARSEIPGGSDIVLIARTDSLQKYGLDEAIIRLKAAVEAGADVVFCEGLHTKEELQKVLDAFPNTPVKASILSGGSAPDLTVEEMRVMGVKMVTLPGLSIGPTRDALLKAYQAVKESGTDKTLNLKHHPKAFFQEMGLDACVELDNKVGSGRYSGI